MNKITESDSNYNHLEKMDIQTILTSINKEDKKISVAVTKAIPSIEKLTKIIISKMKKGGRLFYIGAGTSGRLGILDASECPPTYGIPQGIVVGIIAGGDKAIRQAVENAEDNTNQGWKDLQSYKISTKDVVIGIAASGSTPYVVGALNKCNQNKITTGCITCNPDSPITISAKFPIVAVVGPEFVTGSTRMKSGTAQKLILNMISTTAMIKLGRVQGNKMVDMKLTNNKLVDRGTKIIMNKLEISYPNAQLLLQQHGSIRKALKAKQQ